jgi:Predicted hydrolase (metallo-beta-lactamase superfamily)
MSDLIAIILIFPLLFLNIDKFTTYKVFLFFVIRFVNKYYLKEKLSKIERISLVGIFFIIFDPFIIFQESFILSFIISIFLNFSYLFKRKFKRLNLWLIDIVIVLLLLIPFNINDTYSFNIIRIISNLLISQIMRPLFIFFYLSIFVFRFSFLNGLIETIMNFLSRANFDFFNLNMPQISPFFIFIYYLLLSVVFYFYEVNFKKIGNSILLFLSLSIAVYSIPISNIFTFEVSYINVGQGDSTLIRYEGETILLDTGGLLYSDVATDSLIPYLRSKRIYKIDKIIITHDDYDHSGALDSLIRHYPIRAVYRDNSSFPLKIKDDFLIDNLNVFNFQNDDNNYKSLVLSFKLKDINFLIMGDAPIEVEKMIVAKFPDLKCDILKVGHHGSETSSSEEFIKFLKPKIAIISCGYKNKFHHPNDSVIKILDKYNVTIRRTDLEGTINYKFWL